jgi:molybdate transport system permease protein
MVLPPAVAGIGLLMAFGRRGLLGPLLESFGITIGFTTAAVVMAQVFVAAPFYVRAAKLGFQGVDRELEEMAATLGGSGWVTFWRVTVPLAIYGALESDLEAALAISAILVVVSFGLLGLVRLIARRSGLTEG